MATARSAGTSWPFVIAVVPVVYSLDRGLWVGLSSSSCTWPCRFAARGRLALLAGLSGVLALVAIVVVASPLQSLISQRLPHGKSNAVRRRCPSP